MSQPPKSTWILNRERAIEILQLYESGVAPKQLAEQFGMGVDSIWQRIKLGRRSRMKASGAAE